MNPDEVQFEQFFADRIKSKGYSLKKLSDVTGIAPAHLENMLRGDFGNLPSAPYFRGYLMRLGKVLDFDGEAWWIRMRPDVRNSGMHDTMPKNRFLKSAPPKYLWFVIAGAIVLIYLALQFGHITGKPTLAITDPSQNPFTTTVNTVTLHGTSQNADSITLNGDPVNIQADGTWEKGVLLQSGLNTFQITAKKLLGGQTDVIEQIWYEGSATPVIPSTTATSTPPIHFSTGTSATGSFFQ